MAMPSTSEANKAEHQSCEKKPVPSMREATLPSVDSLNNELNSFRSRLRMSEEWCSRLNKQLQDLLNLPKNEIERFRSRMTDESISLPLFQCYDATLKEKDAEIAILNEECARLRSSFAENTELASVDSAARTAILQATQDASAMRGEADRVVAENIALKGKLTELAELESQLQISHTKDTQQCQAFAEENAQLQQTLQTRDAELQQLRGALHRWEEVSEQRRLEQDAERIQLHLVSKENESKSAEIERLRGKMVESVKRAAENHQTHMRIVEGRHRMQLQSVREELRTHEATILKLRAQLARVESFSRAGMLTGSDGLQVRDADAPGGLIQRAFEMQKEELATLHKEVSSLRVQRDDALFRCEVLTNNSNNAISDALRAARRELGTLKGEHEVALKRISDLQASLETERGATKREEGLRSKYERDLTDNYNQLLVSRQENTRLQHDVTLLREKLDTFYDSQNASAKEASQCSRDVERGITDLQEQFAVERARLKTHITEAETKVATLTAKLEELHTELSNEKTESARRGAELEAQMTKVKCLQNSILQHQKQITLLDERVLVFKEQEGVMKRDIKKLLLEIEKSKLDCARFKRERDSALERSAYLTH